ncbi:MAG TPA: 2-dehydropantoate 2-reductase [Stellaceae bacterium]|nr:2-dehydropantoate 2-reductase [Stellaceae bacterium]
MKIAVFGAGVIGGYLAAKLVAAGKTVHAVARGAQLAAIRSHGLTLIEGGSERRIPLPATDAAASLGPQDLVFVTLKAHSIPVAAPDIASLCGPDTVLIAAQNGIPWWYFYREGGALEGRRIRAVDPECNLFEILDPARAIGCVVQMAAEQPRPGVIRHQAGNRFILGEPSGADTERLGRVASVLREAGLAGDTTHRIRYEIWQKLWGNVAFNPLSALTLATMDRLIGDPGARALALAIMGEAERVANRLGIRFEITGEARVDGLKRLGAYKTSALQDIEAGRPVELGALVDAVVEIARSFAIPTPMMEAVGTLARLRSAPV